MRLTKEKQDQMVNDLIEGIDWVRAYQTFVKVKELNECRAIDQKSPNQLRSFVTKLAYRVLEKDVEVLDFIETNCIRVELVKEDWLDLTFTVDPPMEISRYDIEKIQEFLPDEDFKQQHDSSTEYPGLIIYDELVNDIVDDCDEFIKIIGSKVIETKPPYIRFGQAVFNSIERSFGDVARKVQFEDGIDCFYNDDAVADFLTAVYNRLIKEKEVSK